VIPGFVDKFSIFAQRLLPRRVVPKLVAKISRPSELLYIAASIWPQKVALLADGVLGSHLPFWRNLFNHRLDCLRRSALFGIRTFAR